MKNNSCSIQFKIIVFAITISIILFAFIHSSMPADISSDESESVLGFLNSFLSLFGIGDDLTEHIIRKSAHFIEYTALGVMFALCAYSFNRSKPYKFFPNIIGAGILTAVIDETIQLNVEGRSGQISDVWLDFSGVLTGAVIMTLVFVIFKRIRKSD